MLDAEGRHDHVGSAADCFEALLGDQGLRPEFSEQYQVALKWPEQEQEAQRIEEYQAEHALVQLSRRRRLLQEVERGGAEPAGIKD